MTLTSKSILSVFVYAIFYLSNCGVTDARALAASSVKNGNDMFDLKSRDDGELSANAAVNFPHSPFNDLSSNQLLVSRISVRQKL